MSIRVSCRQERQSMAIHLLINVAVHGGEHEELALLLLRLA